MSYLPMLVYLVCSGADPLSVEELQVAVAALEETLSSQPTLTVSYRTRYESKENPAAKRADDQAWTACVWKRKPGMEFFSESLNQEPKFPIRKWFFNGLATHVWSYMPNSDRLNGVTITPSAPRYELRSSNSLAFTLGYETYYRDGGLGSYLKAAQQGKTVTGIKSKHGLEISLGKHDVNGLKDEVVVTIDPAHDHRLVSWRLEQPTPNGQTIETWQFVCDEFQAVVDEISGEKKWFPLRAHNETPAILTRIEVDSVRINHEIPDDQFISPEPPFGTTVRETSATPGALPQVSLIGGEAARRQRLDELANQSKNELDKLDRDGITYDATPPQVTSRVYWWIFAGTLLLLVCVRWMFQRKR